MVVGNIARRAATTPTDCFLTSYRGHTAKSGYPKSSVHREIEEQYDHRAIEQSHGFQRTHLNIEGTHNLLRRSCRSAENMPPSTQQERSPDVDRRTANQEAIDSRIFFDNPLQKDF